MSTDTIRVLVLDDHDVVRTGIATLLDQQGFEVVGDASDTDEAVALTVATGPDLAIVDVRLRASNGIEAIGRLRQVAPQVRVCMLTSFADEKAARASLQAGATGFIIKDQTADELARHFRMVASGSVVIDHRVASAALTPQDPVLTSQETAILRRIALGHTNREIGEALHISHHTVKEYLSNAMRKLGTRTRAETVATAMREGLIDSRASDG